MPVISILILIPVILILIVIFILVVAIFISIINKVFLNKSIKIQEPPSNYPSKESSEEIFNIADFCERLPFPYIALKGNVIVKYHLNIKKIFEESGETWDIFMSSFDGGINGQMFVMGNEYFRLYIVDYNDYKIYYFIESDYQEANNQCQYDKTIVSLVFIDNYEDVMETVEEEKIPMILSLIDRKLNAMALHVGGIIKKIEYDKYIFLFSSDKLEYLKSKKFDILEKVREINVGNRVPVTLSMGVGINGKNLSQSLVNARAAMDLALGRGGDQVVIKNEDHYTFYGGVSKEIAYNSKVRSRVKASSLQELIIESDNVVIMGHRNADLDCFGAALGVYKIASSLGKKANIVLNNVTTGIRPLYNRVVELEEYKDNVFLTGETALEIISDQTLLIIVDTHRPSILEFIDVYKKSLKIVVFDHHRKSTEFIDNAVLTYHEPYASSTCELITEMLQYIKSVKLNDVEADALLAGITVDTKNFGFKTGAKTFEMAAYLRRNGADTVRVRLLFQYDMESYKAKSSGVSNAEIFNNDIAIAVCPGNLESPSLTAAQTADDLLNIIGIRASFVLTQIDNVVLISARSLFEINVQVIMEALDGGGHQTVAGAQISNITIEEAKSKLKDIILNYMEANL